MLQVVTLPTSAGHRGKDDVKTKNGQGPPEGNSSQNYKDGYRGRSQSPTEDNFQTTKKRKHTKKSKKIKRKIRYFSFSLSATSTRSDGDSSDNDPAIK